MRPQGEAAIGTPRSGALGDTGPAATLILAFLPPELLRNTLLLFKPLMCFVMVTGVDEFKHLHRSGGQTPDEWA